MTATLKYAIVSHAKMELIAKLVREKSVEEALNVLDVMPKKAAKILHKVVKNAYSNAKQGGATGTLKIATIYVGRGPKLKRMRFVGRARMHGYEKPRAFVKVILA